MLAFCTSFLYLNAGGYTKEADCADQEMRNLSVLLSLQT
jgi:hypothetical protein